MTSGRQHDSYEPDLGDTACKVQSCLVASRLNMWVKTEGKGQGFEDIVSSVDGLDRTKASPVFLANTQ